jgi:hypothetical protein
MVVHGLRHLTILATVREIVHPLPVRHVHVSVQPAVRAARLQERGERNVSSLDLHSTETDVADALPRVADLVIDGTAPVDANSALVVDWLQRSEGPSEQTRRL